ncbi:MAG: phosphotransferase [Thermomicrobiales bacterium]
MDTPELTHSLAAPHSISGWATTRWDIGAIRSAELIRSYVNDVYRINTDLGSFALKIFRRSWRSRSDAIWESQLCAHLDDAGIRLALPNPGVDGHQVQTIIYPEGERAALLTPWLGVAKPKPPWTEKLYFDFGRAAARMHQASSTFTPESPGRLLNTDYLIRRPVEKLCTQLNNRPKTFERLLDVSGSVASHLDVLTADLAFGVCQGDLSFDNLSILQDGEFAFYDFDLGGHGWFAFDFAFFHGWTRKDDSAVAFWDAFRAGYGEIREITAAEIEAMPLFDVAYMIWNLEHTINKWTQWSGTWQATDAKVDDMLTTIFELADSGIPSS